MSCAFRTGMLILVEGVGGGRRRMKTRAAVIEKRNGPIAVQETELNPPGPGQVLVKIGVSGVCHSDLSAATGAIPMPLPAVLGHEGAGVVEQVGEGVRSVQPGDRAMLSFITACGRCRYCVIGKPNLCSVHWRAKRGSLCDGTNPFQRREETVYQMSGLGTMAERTVVMENAVIPIPPDVSFERAALVGCGAVLFTAKAEPGCRIAVIGAGGVGVNAIQGAVLAGAEMIAAVDISDEKLKMVEPFGATHLINASRDDPVEAVRELTDGEGVDYAFEAIGNPKTIEQAFAMLNFGGAAVVIGIAPQDAKVSIPASWFPYGERRLIGSMYGSARMRVDMPRLLDLCRAGRLKLDELVTKTYPLDDVQTAFDDLRDGANIRGVLKMH